MQTQAQETIYHPQDPDLLSRIDALKTVLQEQKNIELSLELLKTREWSERLGSADELQHAHKVLSTSFEQAIRSFSDEDLKHAQEQQLLDASQLREIKVHQAQASLKQQRQSQDSYSNQHNKLEK